MAKLTKAQREWRPGMPRKRRSTKVLFASTVLALEAFVVLFATLVVFGLNRDTLNPWLVIGGGVLLSLAMIGTCAFLTKPAGLAAGWVLQLVLIATGFLEPMMFLIGVLFAATWWYGLRAGAKVDRENRERDRQQAEWDRAHAGPENQSAESAGTAAPDRVEADPDTRGENP